MRLEDFKRLTDTLKAVDYEIHPIGLDVPLERIVVDDMERFVSYIRSKWPVNTEQPVDVEKGENYRSRSFASVPVVQSRAAPPDSVVLVFKDTLRVYKYADSTERSCDKGWLENISFI